MGVSVYVCAYVGYLYISGSKMYIHTAPSVPFLFLVHSDSLISSICPASLNYVENINI